MRRIYTPVSYLRIYWATSDFTELPQILLSYLRFYWANSESTELPQTLLSYLRILLSYLGFWKSKFECYLAPRKCTMLDKTWLRRYLVRNGLLQAGHGSRSLVCDFIWVIQATWNQHIKLQTASTRSKSTYPLIETFVASWAGERPHPTMKQSVAL